MGNEIVGKRFSGEWITVSRGTIYRKVQFIDCVLVGPPAGELHDLELHNVQMQNCTLVGQWPQWMLDATKTKPLAAYSDEPEVVIARLNRPVPRQRRSIFNWRNRD